MVQFPENWEGVEKLKILMNLRALRKPKKQQELGQEVKKGPSSKAAGNEKAEAYKGVR